MRKNGIFYNKKTTFFGSVKGFEKLVEVLFFTLNFTLSPNSNTYFPNLNFCYFPNGVSRQVLILAIFQIVR
jgi:hypothetical protein